MQLRAWFVTGMLTAVLGTSGDAQQPAPPVLSTQPTPPPGVPPMPAAMAGLPLQVGDLPPGIIAVRVIRENFANNMANQEVELHLSSGEIRKATTAADGRAQFDAVKVGETVHVRAVVNAEPLGSQRFEVPAEGGVRLVLVAGAGVGIPAGVAFSPVPAPPSTHLDAEPPRRSKAVIPLLLTFASAAGGLAWLTRRRRKTASHQPPSNTSAPATSAPGVDTRSAPGVDTRSALQVRREALFQRLVQLERQPDRAEPYAQQREALVMEIVSIEKDLGELNRTRP